MRNLRLIMNIRWSDWIRFATWRSPHKQVFLVSELAFNLNPQRHALFGHVMNYMAGFGTGSSTFGGQTISCKATVHDLWLRWEWVLSHLEVAGVAVARWRCGRKLGFGPTGGRWPAGSIPGRSVTKSRSTADSQSSSCGQAVYTHCLGGGSGSSRRVWQPFDMAPTCKPGVTALHVRHLLLHVELRSSV
jgi:hypothetical protein